MQKLKMLNRVLGSIGIGALAVTLIANTAYADVPPTPPQYIPYFQTSVMYAMVEPQGANLQDPNQNYLGNKYGITAMYAGMFLENGWDTTAQEDKPKCQLSEVTVVGGSQIFNPLVWSSTGTPIIGYLNFTVVFH